MCLNVELELAQVAIQKCLNLLNDDLVPNTKKLWLINQLPVLSFFYKNVLEFILIVKKYNYIH